MNLQVFNVFLNDKNIDTVFYGPNDKVDEKEVKESLVNHDGYPPEIEVEKEMDDPYEFDSVHGKTANM